MRRPPVKPWTATWRARLPAGVLFLGATCAATAAVAGPWVQPRGGYFAKFSASYLYTQNELNSSGDKVPLLHANPLVQSGAYREVVLFSYAEYGVHDRLTLIGSLPFKIATSSRTEISSDAGSIREIDATNAGFSDLSLGARAALARGSRPVALEAGIKIPLGYQQMPENGGPALGTAKPDFEAALLAGAGAAHAYACVRAAYRVCGGTLDDQAGFNAEVGASHGRMFAQAVVEGWYTTGEIATLAVSSTQLAVNQDITKLIVTAGVRMSAHTALAAEVYHVLDGRNTAAGTTIALGFAIKTP